jgi:hypothetical protein
LGPGVKLRMALWARFLKPNFVPDYILNYGFCCNCVIAIWTHSHILYIHNLYSSFSGITWFRSTSPRGGIYEPRAPNFTFTWTTFLPPKESKGKIQLRTRSITFKSKVEIMEFFLSNLRATYSLNVTWVNRLVKEYIHMYEYVYGTM